MSNRTVTQLGAIRADGAVDSTPIGTKPDGKREYICGHGIVNLECFIRELLLTFSLSSTTCNSAWVSRGFSVIKHV